MMVFPVKVNGALVIKEEILEDLVKLSELLKPLEKWISAYERKPTKGIEFLYPGF